MKKLFLAAILTAVMSVNIYAGNNNIKLNDEYINLETPVKIENGRSYVPLREIGEKILNAEVLWDAVTKTAILTKDNTVIKVTIGSDDIIVNSSAAALDYPAFVYEGKTFVPIRAIAEGFGYNVGYDNGTITINSESSEDLIQFSAVKDDETLAKLCTNYGDITIRFFPEYAPKAVENFIALAENGYYDGITFHRVINNFMIQGGDPTGTGMGGESIWGSEFENEVCTQLRNFRGAVCMANAGADTNSSQFYIVQNSKLDTQVEAAVKDLLEQQKSSDSDAESAFPNNVLEKYLEVGGEPHLDFSYTVFGQVTQGLDVVDKIAAVQTDENDKPVSDVIIEKIKIIK